jgi:hypothetical protein
MTAKTVVTMAVTLQILSIIVPIALDNFFNVNTDAWDAGVVAVWVIIPLAAVLYFGIKFLMKSVSGTGKGKD